MAYGTFGCLTLILENGELDTSTNGRTTSNNRIPRLGNIHDDIKDDTKPKKILRLTKIQDVKWIAYYTQEAASEVGVAILAGAINEHYLVELNNMFVKYKNQTPLSIVTHLYDHEGDKRRKGGGH